MRNKVYFMDCMKGMKHWPDKCFDLAVCDVPYGIGVGQMAFLQERATTVKQKNGTRLSPHKKKKGYTKSDWDSSPPPQAYFDELRRVSREQIIFGVEYVDWEGLGPGRIKWNKGMPEGVSFKGYEMAYASMIDHEHEIDLLWAGMQQAKSISEPMTQQGNKALNEKRIHPCHKPVMLYDIILSTFAKEGQLILDTHIGGGSIRISADKLGISLIGYEVSPEYFSAQEKRYKEFKSQLTLF
jgi:site-specific DNA-methyltransferase (adenine-specific)